VDVYQNETESLGIGKLTIENRTDRVTIYGSLDVTRDKAGLKSAQELKAVVDAIVAYLQGQSLPEQIAFKTPSEKKNPFR
jgi:hypothetical protein